MKYHPGHALGEQIALPSGGLFVWHHFRRPRAASDLVLVWIFIDFGPSKSSQNLLVLKQKRNLGIRCEKYMNCNGFEATF